jgi:hypothetical protein
MLRSRKAWFSLKALEHLKKYYSRAERGYLRFGEASAKEQCLHRPVTEPKRSQNAKRPLFHSFSPRGYSISLNALSQKAARCRQKQSG